LLCPPALLRIRAASNEFLRSAGARASFSAVKDPV